MAKSDILKEFLNRNLLKKYREYLMFSIEDINKKYKSIKEWENGEKTPTQKQLEELAYKYDVDWSFFIQEDATIPSSIENFEYRPKYRNYIKENFSYREVKAINKALKKREDYISLMKEMNETIPESIEFKNKDNPELLASEFLDKINFDYFSKKNKPEDIFKYFRNKIEDVLGILVFINDWNYHNQVTGFEGVALYYEKTPVILVGNHSYNKKIFNLLHEVCHIILKQTAIYETDFFNKEEEKEEMFCNKFAETVLVKNISDFKESLDNIEGIEKYIEDKAIICSKFVVLYRLFHCGKINDYVRSYLYEKYYIDYFTQKEKIKKIDDDKSIKIPTHTKSYFENGNKYLKTVAEAYYSDVITFTDTYLYTKVKPMNFDKLVRLLK